MKIFFSELYFELKKNRGAMIGIVVILFSLFIAVLAPLLAPHNPTEVFPENVRWYGNINGISFSEVILWRSGDSKNKFYACGCETKKIPRYK